jgi:hypothetical protein
LFDQNEPAFPEHFTENMREAYHMLNCLAMISAHALGVYNAIDLWQSVRTFAQALCVWNIRMEILSQEEMEEVMLFGEQEAKRGALAELKAELEGDANTDELEALFNAPSFGEDNEEENS